MKITRGQWEMLSRINRNKINMKRNELNEVKNASWADEEAQEKYICKLQQEIFDLQQIERRVVACASL